MSTPTFTKFGSKSTTTTKLDKAVFDVTAENNELLKLAYTAYLANVRSNLAKTKTRGLVRGGGRKPWKQKGTGHARFGSIRNPIWKGGGIVFGPMGNENYKIKINATSKTLALKQALSLKSNQIAVLESFESKDGKVKPVTQLLNKLAADRNVLLVLNDKSEMTNRATRNIDFVKVIQPKYLNVYDVLNANKIIITKESLSVIHEWLGAKK